MSIKTNLNIAPYFDDYDISKKYYRVLFKPGYAVQARELTQLQSTLQNQIEQFGENIYKEGSIIKGCNFSELRNLKYVKVIDGIRPEDYLEKTIVNTNTDVTDEYYYELEDSTGLKALILQAQSGFQSRAPDLNTFFIVYLNTSTVSSVEKKEYEANDTLQIHEYILRTQRVGTDVIETNIDNGIVNTTSVAGFSSPVGDSFGITSTEGVIFQKGHFLFVDEQTIVLKKYMTEIVDEFTVEPNNISVGFIVDENIVNSQQDISLLDNALGSPNENAPGADRLLLVPRLVSRFTNEAEADSEFFILRRYENGYAVETRSVTQFNSISTELARRTYETHGDFYTKKPFSFNVLKDENTDDFYVEMSEGTAYSKGYRISNDNKRIFLVPPIENTEIISNQPINISYGGYCNVVETSGRITIGSMQNVSLLDSAEDTIGSAIVKNYDEDKLYLFAIRMAANSSFNEVQFVKEGTTNGRIEIEPRILNSSKSKLVFSSGKSFVDSFSDVSFSIRKNKQVPSSANGVITVEPEGDEILNTTSLKDILVIRNDTNQRANVISSDLIGGNLVLQANTAVENVNVYYNAVLPNETSRVKQLVDVYVKTTHSTSQRFYTLGLPDVAEILEIKDSSDTDYLDSFKLFKNQKDDFYDHSYLEKIPGTLSPANGAVLTIKLRVFRVDSSTDINFFTPNSYINIDKKYISFHETQSGEVIDLNSAIDFRPYRIPTALYALTAGVASTLVAGIGIPDMNTQMFSTLIEYAIPSLGTSASVDIEYYKQRKDYIVGSSHGRFVYIRGDELSSGISSLEKSDSTIIAEVTIPGFPLLSIEEAIRLNRRNDTIKVSSKTVKAYTMKDIDSISKKIDRLLYYVSISALEAETQNLLILDENGLNRFKNGIIVDPFNDLSVADVSDTSFSASIDKSEKSLNPSVTQFPINLKVSGLSNTQTYNTNGDIATLASNQLVRFIKQPYATSFRTCTSNFYSYKGVGAITPDYDVAYDTVVTPKEVAIDISTPLIDFTNAINDFLPLTSTSSTALETNTTTQMGSILGRQGDNGVTEANSIVTTTTTLLEDIRSEFITRQGQTEQQFIGDFVTNVNFKPYIRATDVSVEMYGLRPNTRHYFFFDETDVNDRISPAILSSDIGIIGGDRCSAISAMGTPVFSNERGEIFAVFSIPSNRYLVGERLLKIVDVDNLDSVVSSSISSGTLRYNAYNFNIESTGLTVSTRLPEFDIEISTTTRTVVDRIVTPIPVVTRGENEDNGGDPPRDPLAQTFFIKDQMTQSSDALYVGRIDLYFKRKSLSGNGVTIMIREVSNGYPSKEILPFSKKHLKASQVNTSDDSSVATSIIFNAPVRLEPEKEYAIVVLPDAGDPDYLIFTQKVGGLDLISGQAINSDWGEGVLFTSTNDRAWKSYQDEDIKFDLYRYNFNVSSGTVEVESDDIEFFTIQSTVGTFETNELVYSFKEIPSVTYPVVLNSNTNIITGSLLNNYDVGDYLYVENGSGNKDILKVITVTNSTQIRVNKYPSFNGSFGSRPITAATVTYYNSRKPTLLVADRSSARENRVFEASDILLGFNSGASATITSVDNRELSYTQAMINRVSDADTSIKIAIKAVNPLVPDNIPYIENFSFSDKKTFTQTGCIVYSKSNDVGKLKNLKFVLTLENTSSPTNTPFVDIETAKVFAYIYSITNTPENTAKYISKKVELREGFDSEDFRLYVTGYRPKDTDIRAYIKVKNESDPTSLRNNSWIELVKTEGVDLYSSSSNPNDFKEFVFNVPGENKVGNILTYTNSTGVYTTFRSFSIRIDLLSTSVSRVPKLLDYRGVAFE